MVKFTRNPDKPTHPMFVIGGKTYDEVYISKYPNVIINGKAYSLPLQEPSVNVKSLLQQRGRLASDDCNGERIHRQSLP